MNVSHLHQGHKLSLLNAVAMNQLKVVSHISKFQSVTLVKYLTLSAMTFFEFYYLWEFSLHGLAFSIASTHCLQESITLINKLKTIKSFNSYTWSP